jgi:hypothetical protein
MAERGWTAVAVRGPVRARAAVRLGRRRRHPPGVASVVSVAVSAPAVGGAHSVDVEATHAGPPAAVAQMAEEEVAHGPNADAIALAEATRDSQNAEIAEMQQLLTRLGG